MINKKAKTKDSRFIPWSVIVDGLKQHGRWSLVESTPKIKIFERRNERLIAVRLGAKQWKAEYFVAGRLMDTSGTWNEDFVKKMLYEMGVLRN